MEEGFGYVDVVGGRGGEKDGVGFDNILASVWRCSDDVLRLYCFGNVLAMLQQCFDDMLVMFQ